MPLENTEKAAEALKKAAALGLELSPVQESALRQYVELLLEWNSKINLVSRKDAENVWYWHILHSLLLSHHVAIPEGASVLDLGTGGGLPGIPLAIARPGIRITLLDSIKKKMAAVTDMVGRLPVGNVTVQAMRAEELAQQPGGKKCYDLVVARAVAPLVDLIRWSIPLVRKSDQSITVLGERKQTTVPLPALVAMKGGDLAEEMQKASLRYPQLKPMEIRLSLPGEEEKGWEDKKIVLVTLSTIL